MKNKVIIFSLIAIILSIGIILFVPSNKIDCSKPLDVIYMKASEISSVNTFLNNHPNGVVVIPELNRLSANTEILKCKNFNYKDFVN